MKKKPARDEPALTNKTKYQNIKICKYMENLTELQKFEDIETRLSNDNVSYIRGNRNEYIKQFARLAKGLGITEQDCEGHVLNNYPEADSNEVGAVRTIRSVYGYNGLQPGQYASLQPEQYNGQPVFSVFNCSVKVSNARPYKNISLLELAKLIKNEEKAKKIASLTYKSKEYEEAKLNYSHYFTPHGSFEHRKNEGLKNLSKYLLFEADKQENPNTDPHVLKEKLKSDPYVALCFNSFSGYPKWLVKAPGVTTENFRDKYKEASEYFEQKYNIVCDPQQGKLAQPCYIAYDPDVYINQNASHLILKSDMAQIESKARYDIKFPIHIFPESIQKIINETKEALNFPIDFTGSSILYAASVAVGNTTKIEVMKGWEETAILYLALVGRPGTNKSHPLTFALEPIFNRDKAEFAEYQKEYSEFEYASSLTKKEREEQGLEKPEKPILTKKIVQDITPEALADVLQNNMRGIGVYQDELMGWLNNFNRYNSGSEQEFWLSAFSGKVIIIDRKTQKSIRIDRPFISVGGSVQPGLLFEFSKENRSLNGFVDRVLFAAPEDLKKEVWSETEISDNIYRDYKKIIDTLQDIVFDIEKPNVLKYNNDARKKLKEWQAKNTKLCNEAENEALEGIYSKLEIYINRFALILQMLDYATGKGNNKLISESSINGAIELVEYFRKTATKVYNLINNADPLESLPKNKKLFYKSLPDICKKADANNLAGKFNMSEATVKRFLNDKNFFEKIKTGIYEKKL
ncbi:MAG: DUF3987 domain-containing protein [bacterium]